MFHCARFPDFQMKMSPAAKTYLISGYPRSMRDVVEYSEKVIKSESVRPEGIQ